MGRRSAVLGVAIDRTGALSPMMAAIRSGASRPRPPQGRQDIEFGRFLWPHEYSPGMLPLEFPFAIDDFVQVQLLQKCR
jgi:hypothetical protein